MRRRTGVALAVTAASLALLATAFVILVVLAAHDSQEVLTRGQQASVPYGWPLPWLHQDLTGLDPPLPSAMAFNSPWNNPTSLRPLPLLADLALVWGALMVAAALLAASVRGVRRRIPPPTEPDHELVAS